jgi:hypothetical protein
MVLPLVVFSVTSGHPHIFAARYHNADLVDILLAVERGVSPVVLLLASELLEDH